MTASQEPRIRIRFDQDRRICEPGETLSGEFFVDGSPAWDLRAMEISVLWYTEGKGDMDFAIHDFWRLSFDTITSVQIPTQRRPARFCTILPEGPLSYRGLIVKLRWCVRVRGFGGGPGSNGIQAELPFQLGRTSAARLLRRTEPPTPPPVAESHPERTEETGF
ncbi:MAG: hypothetical protein Q4C47_04870 [Planctomycetia bacterium]|nr:hypothetical protein [Planctomycetia bacterium]